MSSWVSRVACYFLLGRNSVLATSALVAFGGAASAEIAFSGYARFGVQYTQGSDAVAFEPGTAIAAADTLALDATDDAEVIAALRAVGIMNADDQDLAITDVDAQYLAAYDAKVAATADLADAQAAVARSIAATGESTTDLDDAVTAQEDIIAAADAIIAELGTAAAIAAVEDALNIDQRFNLDINASAQSDNGLAFGAKVRMRSDESGDNGVAVVMNAPRFSVSSSGMELAVGNIYGAIDSMSGLYSGSVGLTGLGYHNIVTNFNSHGYSSAGAGVNGVELMYSVGDLSLHMSTVKDAATEVALGYAMNGVNVAIGFSNSDTATDAEWVATIGTKVGGVGIGLAAAQSVAGNTSMTLSGTFAAGAATTVTAYLASDEAEAEETAYGIGVVHNLGGGTSVRGGFANTHGTNRADLGVQFNF